MRDRPRDDGATERQTDLRLVRVEEASGATWGMIIYRGVVVRAPFERYRGATMTQIQEWALYEGHALYGVAIAEFGPESSAAG